MPCEFAGLRARRILPLMAVRRTKHGSGLRRWVVERTFAWLNQDRRLRVRYDKRADIHEAFLSVSVYADLLEVPANPMTLLLASMSVRTSRPAPHTGSTLPTCHSTG